MDGRDNYQLVKAEEPFSPTAEYWSSEVKAYLFARMDAIWTSTKQTPYALMDFLQALAWSTGSDLLYLAAIYHISRAEGAHDYVTNEVPRGVRTLAHTKRARRSRVTGAIRGRIDWPLTLRMRSVHRDPASFATVESTRTYDMPENRLLRNYLSALEQLTQLRTESTTPGSLGARLFETEHIAKESLRTSYLRELPDDFDTSALMLARARRSKRALYARLPKLWEEYEATILGTNLDVLKAIMEQGWLAPQSPDDLFELFVLIRAIQELEGFFSKRPDTKMTYGLIRPGGQRIATFAVDNCSADVWFDRNPTDESSSDQQVHRYRELIETYEGLSGATRRPDIGIRIQKGDGPAYTLLVEAKNATPTSQYGRDSIYKSLAYTKDFEQLWTPIQTPKVVLAFPRGVKPKDPESWLTNDVAIIADQIGEQLRKILSRLLTQAGITLDKT